MNILEAPKTRLSSIFKKIKSADSLLKLVFVAGILVFMLSLFMFRFEILASLNSLELQRLESVKPLRDLLQNPYDLFNGLLQNLSLKALPEHQIIGLRLPTILMISGSIVFVASSLYIKFRNRYLPYTYLLLSAVSPLIILLAHQGYLPGIDLLFFGSLLASSFLTITSTAVRSSRKRYFLIIGALSLATLSLQPAGIPIALITVLLISRSTELRYHIIGFKKLIPALSIISIIVVLSLHILIGIKNNDFIKITSGFEAIKN